MLEGQEESRLKTGRNDYYHESPAIIVLNEGKRSKRTHKHSYNAAGGVAIIIGKATKFQMGVRNRLYLCLQSE